MAARAGDPAPAAGRSRRSPSAAASAGCTASGFPPALAERVEAIEVRHVDIRLNFRNALVFYDNVPGLETALLIIGRGSLVFSPSDPSESHQLSLIYKSPHLQDTVSYAYIRCSPSFFGRNITIRKTSGPPKPPATRAETDQAASLFRKLGSNYFTIQTPLSAEPLSFLPQGDEASFEFEGRKSGELAYVYSPFADEEVILYNRARGRFVNFYSPVREKDERRLFVSFGQKSNVERYEIEVAFEPADFRLSARARIRFLAAVDGLDAVSLKFHPSLEILRVYDCETPGALVYPGPGRPPDLYLFSGARSRPSSGRRSRFSTAAAGTARPSQRTPSRRTAIRSARRFHRAPLRDLFSYSQSAQWYPAPPERGFFHGPA